MTIIYEQMQKFVYHIACILALGIYYNFICKKNKINNDKLYEKKKVEKKENEKIEESERIINYLCSSGLHDKRLIWKLLLLRQVNLKINGKNLYRQFCDEPTLLYYDTK